MFVMIRPVWRWKVKSPSNSGPTNCGRALGFANGANAEMPTVQPQLTVRAVRPLVTGLHALGHDPARILASVGLQPAASDDPDAYVPMTVGVNLLARAVEATGDPNLVLHLAEHAMLSSSDRTRPHGSHWNLQREMARGSRNAAAVRRR